LIGSNNQNFEGLVEKLWQAILMTTVKFNRIPFQSIIPVNILIGEKTVGKNYHFSYPHPFESLAMQVQ